MAWCGPVVSGKATLQLLSFISVSKYSSYQGKYLISSLFRYIGVVFGFIYHHISTFYLVRKRTFIHPYQGSLASQFTVLTCLCLSSYPYFTSPQPTPLPILFLYLPTHLLSSLPSLQVMSLPFEIQRRRFMRTVNSKYICGRVVSFTFFPI